MNKVLNVGSINIDHVYRVEHFVQPGETLTCLDYHRFAGGKGLNQSIALANAGASVFHVGKLNHTDGWLRNMMLEKGVDTRFVEATDTPTGHAMIQVNREGENCIVIVGGANQTLTNQDIERILIEFDDLDLLLVQNEISAIAEALHVAHQKGLTTVFNPAPMTHAVLNYPLNFVDILVVNATEAFELTQAHETQAIANAIRERYPQTALLLTLGKQGAHFFDPQRHYYQPAHPVHAIDTTAAGDTFIGFFMARYIEAHDVSAALEYASHAAALCVTRAGAAESIPHRNELET